MSNRFITQSPQHPTPYTLPLHPIPHTLPLLRRAFDRHVQRKSAPSCARFSVTQVGDLNDGLADAVLVLYPRDGKARKVEQNLRASIFGRQCEKFGRAPGWFFIALNRSRLISLITLNHS